MSVVHCFDNYNFKKILSNKILFVWLNIHMSFERQPEGRGHKPDKCCGMVFTKLQSNLQN